MLGGFPINFQGNPINLGPGRAHNWAKLGLKLFPRESYLVGEVYLGRVGTNFGLDFNPGGRKGRQKLFYHFKNVVTYLFPKASII